jgi:hypothetical protein
MPSDVPDVWRDEDGPSDAELERWASGDLASLAVNPDRRRVLRVALKSLWASSSLDDQRMIDEILADLKP